MDTDRLAEYLDFAVAAARDAGRLTLDHFRTGTTAELKPDQTPVTAADRAAERLLRERITATYPDHGIVGEEYGEIPGRAPARWILDPIDGTVSFLSGVPLYAVLVALEWEGRVVVGVIHLPALDETVCAAVGLGCRRNGRPARTSDVADLAQARVLVTDPKLIYRRGRGAGYERLRDACRAVRGWSDAYGYALLATGRAEVVLDPLMALWDTAALAPVVTEAGGTLTDWTGRATHTAPEAVATNGPLFNAVMATLRGD